MLRWFVGLLKAFVAKFWGTTKKVAGAIARAYSLGPADRVDERQVVSYKSRRHGLRVGRVVRIDRSGRVVFHLDDHPAGVTLRRQPYRLMWG